MSLEDKLKCLDRSKKILEHSLEELFDSGVLYDSVFPEEKENRFYKLRWQLEQQKEKIKIRAQKLRIEQVELENKAKQELENKAKGTTSNE